ncbi:MAG TPA: Chromate resistance protein ChrB [Actinomycetota bacterium]|nr:Chromate resistance protein ChrB [Actinomycetota bacterium]
MASAPSWRLLIYRLPKEPSRHRVAVWRELRRAGAVALQQATWAAPRGELFDAAVARAVGLVERAEGQALVVDVAGPETSLAALEALFTAEREEEWGEFLAECDKYEVELASEVAKEKFTLAELDEEEQSHERLRRWHRELRARDLFGAPSADAAERRLKECAEALEDYAQRVFQARGR